MIKKMLILLFMVAFGLSASAKEKLYILNTGSTGGSFNGQMTAYAEDLKEYYDIEYLQGKHCYKGGAAIQKIVDNGHKVFYIWNGFKVAEFLQGKNDACGKLPTKENFVNSVLKYPIFFTLQEGIDKKDVFKNGMTVGYNSDFNLEYLTGLAKSHGVNWQFVRYENSKGVRLGVVNKEVDFGMMNSAASFWKKSKKLNLKGLYTLNANGENGLSPLASVSEFQGAGNGIADLFLIEGGDNQELRKIVADILADPNSKISIWYSTAKGYTQTIDMDIDQAIEVTNANLYNWVTK